MRLFLLIAVIALGVDAIRFDGAYSQSAWQAVTDQFARFQAELDDADLLDRRVAASDEDR